MIFWFSGTGNSRHVTKLIAHYTHDATQSITDAVQNGQFEYTLSSKEALGFVMPTYYWGIPAQVHAFLQKLVIKNEKRPYTYLILTCGGSTCNAASQVIEYLPVDYVDSVTMPDNFIVKYDVKHRDDIRLCLTQADAALNKIYGKINRRERPKRSGNGLLFSMMTKTEYPKYEKRRHTDTFYVTDQCTGCGFCAEICPDKAIEMVDGKPKWIKPMCDLCLACLHRCPVAASQYSKRTEGYGRYVHPDLAAAHPAFTEE